MHFERPLISLWFRFRFRCRSARLTVSRFVHFTHSICYFFYRIFAHSTFVVYSPNFGLSFRWKSNALIHSFSTHRYSCICFAGCTSNNNNNEKKKSNNNSVILIFTLLLFFCKQNTFAVNSINNNKNNNYTCERREAPGTGCYNNKKNDINKLRTQ